MPHSRCLAVFEIVFLATAACAAKDAPLLPRISTASFGRMNDGQTVDLYTLTNRKGMVVKITNYGGRIVSLKVLDRAGRPDDVVLGFDTLDEYLQDTQYLGALLGRYANRIAKGRFTLNGVEYTLSRNDGENHLHGGFKGFDKVLWKARDVSDARAQKLELTYLSRDGEEGYPGNLAATVVYSLNDANELQIDYSATTDQDTIVNLTNHSYFNLTGQGGGDILGHVLTIHADKTTPLDKNRLTTGEVRNVEGTPMDFRTPTVIGDRIHADYDQLNLGGGYRQDFVLPGGDGSLTPAVRVYEPKSGRVMEVATTEPGVVLYTSNTFDGTVRGKGGKPLVRWGALCLETQHFPDTPNKPHFPSVALKPGGRYHSLTVFRFTTAR
jgi:aldose 1-epimerase